MAKLRRLWIQLTADRRRFAVLCTVFLLGMLLWARLIVISNVPRTAIADEADAAQTPDEGEEESSASDRARRVIPLTALGRPDRDPFAINPRFFPDPNAVVGKRGDQGKSGVEPVEDPQQAERRRIARLQASVERLRLEAVMTGVNMAVIDGQTYRLGEQVTHPGKGSITLLEVRQRSVVLGVEDLRFELRMTSPEG